MKVSITTYFILLLLLLLHHLLLFFCLLSSSSSSSSSSSFSSSSSSSQIIVMDGNISNEMELHYFPWDWDDVNLIMVAEMDTFDRNVRLFWQESRVINNITPAFLDNQLTEWNLYPNFNTLMRLPKFPGGVGKFCFCTIHV